MRNKIISLLLILTLFVGMIPAAYGENVLADEAAAADEVVEEIVDEQEEEPEDETWMEEPEEEPEDEDIGGTNALSLPNMLSAGNDVCTCTSKCAEDNVNDKCPVCLANYEDCEFESYGVWIQDIQLNSSNIGKFKTGITTAYDGGHTITITLNNALIESSVQEAAILSNGMDLVIELSGSNRINAKYNNKEAPTICGIKSDSDVEIRGEGSLSISVEQNNKIAFSYCVNANQLVLGSESTLELKSANQLVKAGYEEYTGFVVAGDSEAVAKYVDDSSIGVGDGYAKIEPHRGKFDYNYENAPIVNGRIGADPEPSPEPTREGYTFLGWYDNADCTGEPIEKGSFSPSGEYYAGWKKTAAIEASAKTGLVYNGEAQEGYDKDKAKVTPEASGLSKDDIVPTYYKIIDGKPELTDATNSGAEAEGGAPKYAGEYRLELIAENDDYYAVKELSFSIKKMPVSIEGIKIKEGEEHVKEYDGKLEQNPDDINFDEAGITQEIEGKELSLDVTAVKAEFDNKNVGKNKHLTIKGIKLLEDGLESDNYEIAPIVIPASIEPKKIQVTDLEADNREYDGDVYVEVKAKLDDSGICADDDGKKDELSIQAGAKGKAYNDLADIEPNANVGPKLIKDINIILEGADAANYYVDPDSIDPELITPPDMEITHKRIMPVSVKPSANGKGIEDVLFDDDLANASLIKGTDYLITDVQPKGDGSFEFVIEEQPTDRMNNFVIDAPTEPIPSIGVISLEKSGVLRSVSITDPESLLTEEEREKLWNGQDYTLVFSGNYITSNIANKSYLDDIKELKGSNETHNATVYLKVMAMLTATYMEDGELVHYSRQVYDIEPQHNFYFSIVIPDSLKKVSTSGYNISSYKVLSYQDGEYLHISSTPFQATELSIRSPYLSDEDDISSGKQFANYAIASFRAKKGSGSKTGDESNLPLMITLLLVSLAGIAALAVVFLKKRKVANQADMPKKKHENK